MESSKASQSEITTKLRNVKSKESKTEDQSYLKDAGNQQSDHYKSRLSPFRYKLRNLILPLIRKETEFIYNLQQKIRNPYLDYYFAFTATLASHTFYVLMLPLPIWLGAGDLGRDLVYVLGFGIFFTGNFKDYLCLPRPRSPPVHRITLSTYTTQEYGFPSSHSANATAVTLVLLFKMLEFKNEFSYAAIFSIFTFLFLYYTSLIFGRIYCGMHGFIDIAFGSLIGTLCFAFRFFYGKQWDNWLLISHNNSISGLIFTPLFIIFGYISLIHFHSAPVDDCPCFDDSVAFIGVLIGLDFSHWACHLTQYLTLKNPYNDPILINFDFDDLGILKTFMRLIMGIAVVATWKAVSKPFIFTLLPPIYKFVGVYLPRSNYVSTAHSHKSTKTIRRQSISNMQGESFSEFIREVAEHENVDKVGPESDVDVYEILDYKKTNQEEAARDVPKLSGVFKPRYDVEIIGRLFVYSGIAVTAVWIFALGINVLNL